MSNITPPQPSNHEKTPEQYVLAITSFAKREMRESIYPGINYRRLAMFLTSNKPHLAGIQPQSRTKHNYVVIHDLAHSHGNDSRVSSFDSEDGIKDFIAHPMPPAGSGHLAFIRGFPSPKWLAAIGARYGVDPEYFRRFLSLDQHYDLFDSPSLPSSSANIIKIPITTIGRHSGFSKSTKSASEHFTQLEGYNGVGHSIARAFSIHDGAYFSIEQSILACIIPSKKGAWNGEFETLGRQFSALQSNQERANILLAALICSDIGRDFSEGPEGLWSCINPKIYGDIFLPTIRSEPRISLKKFSKWSFVQVPPEPGKLHSPFMQSASLIPHESYGRFLSEDLMRGDAFYALSELFSFSASSENQFLNFLKWKLDAVQESKYVAEDQSMQSSLDVLMYHKKILERHMDGLHRTISAIEGHVHFKSLYQDQILDHPHSTSTSTTQSARYGPQRPQTASQTPNEIELMYARLLVDFKYLHQTAKILTTQYKESMDDIRNKVYLYESQRGISQAQGVAHLTLLAFFFVPLSFTTSFFGMNFFELSEDRGLRIWVWFLVSIPIMLVSFLIGFWKEVKLSLYRYKIDN